MKIKLIKPIVISTLTVFLLMNCEKETPVQQGADDLYTPYLTSIRKNEGVTLKWIKPGCLMCGFCDCPQLEPTCFDILISDTNLFEFNIHSTVSNKVFEVTLDNLANGNPYYFAIRAVGNNGQYSVSNTIMAIPDDPENIQTLLRTIDKSVKYGTWSPDQASVAYESDYYWNNGNNYVKSVFIYNLSNSQEWLVEKNSSSPEWSPTGQKIAYHTENGEIQPWYGYSSTHIAVFNIQDNTINRMTDGNSFNYLPTWSPDGKWIAYLSDKAGSNEYNLWKIPSDSGLAIQITSDFNDLNELAIMSDRSLQKPSWSKNGNEIAFSRLNKLNNRYVFDIYSIPSSGGTSKTVITSQWNDRSPVYSPNRLEIAFISDRSGVNEIWSMNLQTKKLKQITGSYEQWVYDRWIEWSASGDRILFTSSSDNFSTLYIVDVN